MMREEIIVDDEGDVTRYIYNDLDLCIKMFDETRDGEILRSFFYQYDKKILKGWVEFNRDCFVRSYIVNIIDEMEETWVFDNDGNMIEKTLYSMKDLAYI